MIFFLQSSSTLKCYNSMICKIVQYPIKYCTLGLVLATRSKYDSFKIHIRTYNMRIRFPFEDSRVTMNHSVLLPFVKV